MCLAVVCVLAASNTASADIFGSGLNQFTIDFVSISADTNPVVGYGIVNYDYHMATYEISNDQWTKFKAAYGAVKGSPSTAYDTNPIYVGANMPVSMISWYEAAQFVNYLNTSTGHQAAYKFTGTQGTSSYTLAVWSAAEADNGTNLYRNKDAKYFLPTEDEWVKAAYWNGADIKTYATKAGESVTQGDGISGTGWNYYTTQYAAASHGPWAVGSGSQELNGTYDMMGNVWEWMENPSTIGDYETASYRGIRGGSYYLGTDYLTSSYRNTDIPYYEDGNVGFRIASTATPEPATLVLLGLGVMVLSTKSAKRKA